MADTHPHADAAHAHHGPATIQPYLVVFGALCGFTLVSFVVNYFVRGGTMSAMTGFIVILGVAVVKALLVCAYFMHLKWDWGRLYFLIIPAMVLAPMLVFALVPDIVLYWHNVVTGWNNPPLQLPR